MIAAEQAKAFAVMALCGAACALTHDAARLTGWIFGGRAAFTALMDLVLGVWLAVGMTAAGLHLGVSPMRLYLFAGVALGALFWYGACGLPVRSLGRRLQSRWADRQKIGK